jgi:MFS family permease
MTVDETSVRTSTSYRTLRGNRELLAMLTARALSGIGDQVARAVLALVVLQRADGGPLLSALVLAVGYLPLTLGFALLGSLADRFPRRQVLLVCDLARAALITVLALLLGQGLPVWTVLVVLFVAELFSPASASASQALLPDVSRSHVEYQQANAVKGTVDQVVQVLGFVVGGLVLQFASASTALLLDAGTFVVSFAVLAVFVRRRPAPAESGTSPSRLLGDLRRGVRVIRHTRSLRWLVTFAWISAAMLVATDGVALPYAVGQGASDSVATALLAATPAGAAIAAFVVGRWSMARQVQLMFPLAAASTIPMVVSGFEPTLLLTWALWFAVGLCQGYIVTVMTLTVLIAPDDQRGQVTGLAAAGFNTVAAATFLVMGWVAQSVTAAFALCLAGSVGLAVLVLTWMAWPTRDVNQSVRTTYGATSRRT